MNDPLRTAPDALTGLELGRQVAELFASPQVRREGKAARVLVKGPPLTIVLTVMRAGTELLGLPAPDSVMLVPLRGHVRFDGASPLADADIEPASSGRAARQRLEAVSDSAFLLLVHRHP